MTLDANQLRVLEKVLYDWLFLQGGMREKVKRPWAIINNQVVTQEVVFHDPDAMR